MQTLVHSIQEHPLRARTPLCAVSCVQQVGAVEMPKELACVLEYFQSDCKARPVRYTESQTFALNFLEEKHPGPGVPEKLFKYFPGRCKLCSEG